MEQFKKAQVVVLYSKISSIYKEENGKLYIDDVMNSIANYRGNYDFKCPNCKNSKDDLMFSKQPTICNECDKLKINPKDNTITIKELKDNWNKKDLESIANEFFNRGLKQGRGNMSDIYDCNSYQINKYIEENL